MYGPIRPVTKAIGNKAAMTVKVARMVGPPTSSTAPGMISTSDLPGNKPWCEKASALFVVASRVTRDDGRPARTHAFDTGAAWMSLALEAHLLGLVAHGMEGFDYERAAQAVGLPADHAVHCMVAVGRPGQREDLPEPYRSREQPNDRCTTDSFAFEARFPA